MSRIFRSASKIVLILFAVSAVALTFKGILDPKDFMLLAIAVFGYYFGTNTPFDE